MTPSVYSGQENLTANHAMSPGRRRSEVSRANFDGLKLVWLPLPPLPTYRRVIFQADVNIDAQLLAAREGAGETVMSMDAGASVAMQGGCICCTLLEELLLEVSER